MTDLNLAAWSDPDELLSELRRLSRMPAPQDAHSLSDAVSSLLEHADEEVRQEALRLLLITWKLSEFRQAALDALAFDADDDVRITAAFSVASVSRSSTSADDTRALLAVLDDVSNPVELVRAAYEGLLLVHRKIDFPPLNRSFDSKRDVNWEWIRQLR